MEEKREHERYPIDLKPEYFISFRSSNEKEFQKAVSINISYGGAMFVTDTRYERNSEIEIMISFPKNEEPVITLQGIVRWIEKKSYTQNVGWKYSIGLQFDKLTESQRSSLNAFIDNYISNE